MEGDNPHLSLKLQVKDACLILLKSSVSSGLNYIEIYSNKLEFLQLS